MALGYKATELKKIKKFFEGTTDTAENYIKSALKNVGQIGAEHDKTLFVGQDDQSALHRYHDEEWGQPLHDDQVLFELLCMETYQAVLRAFLLLLIDEKGVKMIFK